MSARAPTQHELVQQYNPDEYIPVDHMGSACDDAGFTELGRDAIDHGTIVTEECNRCGYVRPRVEHSLELSFDVDDRLAEIIAELPDPPYYAVEHVAYMKQRFAVLPTEAEARKYAAERFGGLHGDYRLSRVQRPEILCLYEPRTERVVKQRLLPDTSYRGENESSYHHPVVREAIESFTDPAAHVILSGSKDPARFEPDGYDGTQLDWHLEQIESLELHVQTTDLLLDDA